MSATCRSSTSGEDGDPVADPDGFDHRGHDLGIEFVVVVSGFGFGLIGHGGTPGGYGSADTVAGR